MAKRTTSKGRSTKKAAKAVSKRKSRTRAKAKESVAKSAKRKASSKSATVSKAKPWTPARSKAMKTGSTKTRIKQAGEPASGKTVKAKATTEVPPKKSNKVKSAPDKRGAKATSSESRDPALASDGVFPFAERTRAVPKTRLTPKHLREFRQLLVKKRAELAGNVTHLAGEVVDRKRLGPNEHTSMPIHMADVGSDNWEKEFTLGLIANEHAMIREIDDALARIGNRTYGVCLATHKQISLARLRAKPWAKYCIEYARAREEGRVL